MSKNDKVKTVDYVAQGKDWTDVILNEKKAAKQWVNDWGFLVDDQEKDRNLTNEDKIMLIEEVTV